MMIRTKNVLSRAGRTGHGISYCLKRPDDCPEITRMLAVHVFTLAEWCSLRNAGRKTYEDLVGER